jgi:4-hydroxybenzoate polyprenyltransferase
LAASAVFLPNIMVRWIGLGFVGLLFFGHQYSATPIRAKARPFWDSAFNVLYVFPVLIGWGLSDTHASFPWLLFVAGTCWCMAMHAFSAVPDIEADQKALMVWGRANKIFFYVY